MSGWEPTPEPRRVCGDCKHFFGVENWGKDSEGFCHLNLERDGLGNSPVVSALHYCAFHEWPNEFYERHEVRYREP